MSGGIEAMIHGDTVFVVCLFRLGFGELAKSFTTRVREASDFNDLATTVGARAALAVDRDMPKGASQIVTVTVIDPSGAGGASWQCLTPRDDVEQERFAQAVASVVFDMTMHAIDGYLSGRCKEAVPPLAGTPGGNAPGSDARH